MHRQVRSIRVMDLVLYFWLPLALWAVLCTLTAVGLYFVPTRWIVWCLFGIFTYVCLRFFAIGVVLVYKAYAPLKLRRQCLFEPCCSTYMILSIRKYGLIIGIIRGVRRILRCHPPNGGVDLP